jgi:hypothetical protein
METAQLAKEQKLDWMPPVNRAELEANCPNSDPINRMKSSQWCQFQPMACFLRFDFYLNSAMTALSQRASGIKEVV